MARAAVQPYAGKVASLRGLIATLDGEIAALTTAIAGQLDGHRGYTAIQELPGMGPVLAAVIVAEIGDVRRFPKPGKLCSWAWLTPATASPTSRPWPAKPLVSHFDPGPLLQG